MIPPTNLSNRQFSAKYLLSLFLLLLPLWCCNLFPAVLAAPSNAVHHKRSAIEMVRIIRRGLSTDSIKKGFAEYSQPMDQAALQMQRSIFGIKSMNFNESYDAIMSTLTYYQSLPLAFSSVQQDRSLLSLFIVLCVSLGLGVLTTLIGIFFCCGRMCNKCGGRKPNPDGYTAAQISRNIGCFILTGAIIIAFASLGIVYTFRFSESVDGIKTGTSSLLTDVDQFAVTLKAGFAQSGSVVQTNLQKLINNITAIDYAVKVNASFNTPVDNLLRDLTNLQSGANQLKIDLTSIQSISNSIKTDVTAASSQVNTINTRVNAMTTVTINGQSYPVAGVPSTSDYSTSKFPNMNQVPDISAWLSTINGLPNMTAAAESLRKTFSDLRTQLPKTLNSSIGGNLPSGSSLTSGFTGMINASLEMVSGIVGPQKSSVESSFYPLLSMVDMIRNYATIAQFGLVLLALLLSFIGIIFKRHRLMLCFPIVVVLLAIVLWLQFIIYFLLSLPLNTVCTSRAAVFNSEISVPLISVKIVPNVLIDSCVGGENLFAADINSNGDTVTAIIGDFVSRFVLNIGFLSNSSASSYVNLPTQTTELNSMQNASFSDFNQTALSFPTAIPFNLTVLKVQLETFNSSLTPASFDATLGSQTSMNQAIADFNTYVTSVNSNHNAFTYVSIKADYLDNNTPFNPATVSQSSNAAVNQEVQVRWNTLYPFVNFKFGADQQIAVLQSNITSIHNDLTLLQTVRINSINTNLVQLNSTAAQLSGSISLTTGNITVLSTDMSLLTNATTGFIDDLMSNVRGIITNGTGNLLDDVLVSNPVEGFANCKPLAQDTAYVLDGVCVGVLNSSSGLWASFALVAFLSIIGLIVGMRAKKRIDYLAKRSLFTKVGDKMTNKDDSLDSL